MFPMLARSECAAHAAEVAPVPDTIAVTSCVSDGNPESAAPTSDSGTDSSELCGWKSPRGWNSTEGDVPSA